MTKSLRFSIASFVAVLMINAVTLSMMYSAPVINQSEAADLMLDTQIKTATVATDKNGNEYVRFIIVEDKELNGVAYKADTVVMCFGSIVETAKTYSDGDALKAIASSNEYKGRVNYNILAFIAE